MSRARVLVVDDDEDIRQVLSMVLVQGGYDVSAAGDGKEALDLLERQPVDLVLLDMKMPVMDGWAFAKELRRRRATPPPIVSVTAAGDARKWAEEIGADGVVAKPFDLDELLELIRRTVKAHPQ